MRIIKAVAALATILWVSAIGWEQATRRVETDDWVVADVDDSDPYDAPYGHVHVDFEAVDPSFPMPEEDILSATRVTDCVAIDFDAADETAGSLPLPN